MTPADMPLWTVRMMYPEDVQVLWGSPKSKYVSEITRVSENEGSRRFAVDRPYPRRYDGMDNGMRTFAECRNGQCH